MRLLLDMNISPTLCGMFAAGGHEVSHWSAVGALGASDAEILRYADRNNMIVVTHDLDFGALLAASHASGPSVIQFRTQDVLSQKFVDVILSTLARFEVELAEGALVVIDERRSRVRVLPILGRTATSDSTTD
jgi:predicted nuclease of predicted toxin-antitoxin system